MPLGKGREAALTRCVAAHRVRRRATLGDARLELRTARWLQIVRVAAPPATSRHPNHSLPLLPSGPGGICKLSSRENRRGHHRTRWWRRERDSNPRSGLTRLHTFQACSFNHSDTSPVTDTFYLATIWRDCSSHPETHPRFRSGQLRCPNSFPTNLVEPAKRV